MAENVGTAAAQEVGNIVGEGAGAIVSELEGLMKVLTDFNVIGFALGVLTANAGADISPGFRFTMEGALRDDIKRIGASLAFTY